MARLGVPKSAATGGTAEVLHIEAFDPSVEWHEADLEAKVESVRSDIKTLDSRLSAKFNVLGLRRRLDARLPFRAREP